MYIYIYISWPNQKTFWFPKNRSTISNGQGDLHCLGSCSSCYVALEELPRRPLEARANWFVLTHPRLWLSAFSYSSWRTRLPPTTQSWQLAQPKMCKRGWLPLRQFLPCVFAPWRWAATGCHSAHDNVKYQFNGGTLIGQVSLTRLWYDIEWNENPSPVYSHFGSSLALANFSAHLVARQWPCSPRMSNEFWINWLWVVLISMMLLVWPSLNCKKSSPTRQILTRSKPGENLGDPLQAPASNLETTASTTASQ